MERQISVIDAVKTENKKLRVAAYCRVSSDSADQLHSFAAQVRYYTNYIESNENMELADIYADEGITGTCTASRNDFNRLIADCKKGKIDRVLTKSMSRFARNTVDSIKYARLLREYGVSVLFEKENIDTEYMSSELLLAISGAQAQEESLSISKNVRWGVQKRMKDGTYIASSAPYGYRLVNGEFVIDEKEADVVRFIFDKFLSGTGKKDIVDMLNLMDAPKWSKKKWYVTALDYILTNERYIGDALFQKYYTTDTLPFKCIRNNGVKPKYYVENTNPPIISKSDFDAAQEIINRNKRGKMGERKPELFNKMIHCGCGATYQRKVTNKTAAWACKRHEYDSSLCSSRRIPEADITEAYIVMMNKLREHKDEIILPAIKQTRRLQEKSGGLTAEIKETDRKIAELNNKLLVLARLNSKGIIKPSEFTEQSAVLNGQVTKLRTQRRELFKEQDKDEILTGLTKLYETVSDMTEPITEFDIELFRMIVTKMTVPTDTSMMFHLIGGLPIEEYIPDNRRVKNK